MDFKMDLKKQALPSGFYYGYKSDRSMYPYFPNIELSEEKRDEPHIIIPYYNSYDDKEYLTVNEFNDELQKQIYLDNDFISYKDGIFSNGYNEFGKNKIELVSEKTNCAYLIEDEVRPTLNYIKEIDYFDFCELVKQIDEFKDEDVENELRYTTGLGGRFFKLDNKAFCCLERFSNDSIYISYLAVFKEYRKQGYLEKMIGGVKNKFPERNLSLAVVEPKIEQKYLDLGFKKIGYLKNYVK